MNKTKRHIKARFEYLDINEVNIQILEQTHRGDNFAYDSKGNRVNNFKSINGLVLRSDTHIMCRETDSTFFVLGDITSMDKNSIVCDIKTADRIKEAFQEYNEHYEEWDIFKPCKEIVG